MGQTKWLRGGKALTGGVSAKHLHAFLGHSTPRKLWNLVCCETEIALNRIKVQAKPYILKIDLTNACNLRCPGCPTGIGLIGRRKTILDLSRIDQLLAEVAQYAYIAHLYNWGESLLHRQAPEVVRRFVNANICTSLSSHLSIKDFNRIEAVCEAGLDHLTVSIDGTTSENYQRYRRGGNFELVMSNLQRLVKLRETKRFRTVIEWQMLAFGHLEGELETAFQLAKSIGVDWFRTRAPIAPTSQQPRASALMGQHHGVGRRCGMPWRYLAVQSDGGVSACCNTYFRADDFGSLEDGSIKDIRNNPRFQDARRLFSKKLWRAPLPEANHPCLRCPVLHGQAHAEELRRAFPGAACDKGFMGVLEAPHLAALGKAGSAWGGLTAKE